MRSTVELPRYCATHRWKLGGGACVTLCTLIAVNAIGCVTDSDPASSPLAKVTQAWTPPTAPCGAVIGSFGSTNVYSNGADTGTTESCAGNGVYGPQYQSQELVMRHFKSNWGFMWLVGDDLLGGAPKDKVDVRLNGDGAHPPVPGDIISWNDTGSGPHAALVTEVHPSGIEVVQQNVKGAGAAATLAYDGTTVGGPIGWSWKKPDGWAHAKANLAGAPDRPVVGSLDTVNCDHVNGWAYDPDTATVAIDVRLLFDGDEGSGFAMPLRVHAGARRDDLCSRVGSCGHAFDIPAPLGVRDGRPHPVFAYGLDTGLNVPSTKLPGGGKTLTCDVPPPPRTANLVRRAISAEAFVDWNFSQLEDVAHYGPSRAAKWTEGAPLPSTPRLAKVYGSPDVWVIDGKVRRRIPDVASFGAWRFDSTSVATWTADALEAYPRAAEIQPKPLIVQGDPLEMWLLDERIDGLGGPITPGNGGSGRGPGGGTSSSRGCGLGGTGAGGGTPAVAPFALLAALLIAARGRRRMP